MKSNHFLFLAIIVSLMILGSCAGSRQFQVKNDYMLHHVTYRIDDNEIRQALKDQKHLTAFKKGQSLDQKTFEKERKRIERIVRREVDPDFDKKYVSFQIDTTLTGHQYAVVTVVRRNE